MMMMSGKLNIEVQIISARGLPHSPSLLKPHWFAVSWIDPSSKYITNIPSNNRIPTLQPKLLFEIDGRRSSDLALIVEIYRREPLFLTTKLHGTATIMLTEFLDKFKGESHEDISSFQLRKRNSRSPRGFVDVSVRASHQEQGSIKPDMHLN